MTDLVARLRWHREHPLSGILTLANPDGPEAADRIAALEADLARAEGLLAEAVDALTKIDDLTQHNMGMDARDETCVNHITRAILARIKELDNA